MERRLVPAPAGNYKNSTEEWKAMVTYEFRNKSGSGMQVVYYLAFVLAAAAVALHIYARMCTGFARGLRSDDYVLLFSWLITVGLVGLAGWVFHLGYGHGLPEHYGSVEELILKFVFVAGPLGIAAMAMCKVSLGMLYWNLLRDVPGRLWWYALANLVFLVLSAIGLVLWKIFCCVFEGEKADWDTSMAPDRVAKQVKCTVCNFYMLNGHYVVSLVSDIFFIALAVPLLRRVGLSRSEKMTAFAMFALSGLTIVASTICYVQEQGPAVDPHLGIRGDDILYYRNELDSDES